MIKIYAPIFTGAKCTEGKSHSEKFTELKERKLTALLQQNLALTRAFYEPSVFKINQYVYQTGIKMMFILKFMLHLSRIYIVIRPVLSYTADPNELFCACFATARNADVINLQRLMKLGTSRDCNTANNFHRRERP